MFSHAHYLPTTPLKTNEKLWARWIGFSEADAQCVAQGENNRPGPCRDNHPASQICFTKLCSLGQPRAVGRSFAVCTVLAVLICCARGQEQERKLVDRLLKPDMALQNDAQNRKFTADGSASINRRASTGSFYVQRETRSKNFSGTRDFATSRFYSQFYHGRRSAYEVSSRQTMSNSQFSHANQTVSGLRNAPQSGKKVASRAYPGSRQFLDEGKSQKSLNQQNAPLTIDQVRELLNKNK
jgi:hypothetical protein